MKKMNLKHVVGAALAALPALVGCTTRQAPEWSDRAATVEPEQERTLGYLSVEMIDPLVMRSRVPRMRSAPFLLYDDRGRYLTKYNDPYLPPVSMAPGRYIVIAHVEGKDRRIQVLIRPTQLTRVNLSSLPERRHPENPAEPAESLPETH
jgi:hypothetical protein